VRRYTLRCHTIYLHVYAYYAFNRRRLASVCGRGHKKEGRSPPSYLLNFWVRLKDTIVVQTDDRNCGDADLVLVGLGEFDPRPLIPTQFPDRCASRAALADTTENNVGRCDPEEIVPGIGAINVERIDH